MSGEGDQAKGRIKQAIGDLTDDKDLKREGKVDEAAGKVKEGVDKVKDKLDGQRLTDETKGRGHVGRAPSSRQDAVRVRVRSEASAVVGSTGGAGAAGGVGAAGVAERRAWRACVGSADCRRREVVDGVLGLVGGHVDLGVVLVGHGLSEQRRTPCRCRPSPGSLCP